MIPNPGGVVYGTITVGALLAAESAARESYAETIAAVAIALVVYWLAHTYSEFTEHRLEEGKPASLKALGGYLLHELTIIAGAAVPLVALLICWAAGARLSTGVDAALWTSVAVIIAVEIAAGLRAELSGGELLAQAAVGAVFGALIIGLKVVLH